MIGKTWIWELEKVVTLLLQIRSKKRKGGEDPLTGSHLLKVKQPSKTVLPVMRPIVQKHEPRGDISHPNHNTE